MLLVISLFVIRLTVNVLLNNITLQYNDRLSKGRMAKFDPTQIRNPSTDRHKIWNRWLRRRNDPLCKISCKSVHWGLLGK